MMMAGARPEEEAEGGGGGGGSGDGLSIAEGKVGGPMFSMRIVSLEYYMAPPLPGMDVCYSQFQGCAVNEVPVVRIYGSTPAGQKACLHLHQVFPYFYVPYDEDLPQDIKEALAYVRCLASAVEKAMKLTNNMAAKKQHVHSCSLVRARKYYGYHPAEQLFVKIVLYHPQDVSRISALLMGGGIMNCKFQPHEAHVPYLLQLLIDQNLSGMSHIHLSGLKFRHPLPESMIDIVHVLKQLKTEFASQASISTPKEAPPASSSPGDVLMPPPAVMETVTPPLSNEKWAAGANGTSQTQLWLGTTVPSHWQWPGHYGSGGPFARHTTCALEADASVEDILNQNELLFVPLQQAGSAIKMVQSLTSMWEEERVRSGEDGPAGAMATLQPSAERVIPPPSAVQQALRASLSQIIQGNEMFSQAEEDGLQKSVGKAQEMLLESTQAANIVRQPGGSDEMGQFSETMVAMEAVDTELLNEQIVRTSLTQHSLTSQEDGEMAELLRWMGASPDDHDGDDGCSKDEQGHEAYDSSQLWGSAGMEAAMLQAISEYETETHQECQAILECVDGSDSEENVEDLFETVLENNKGIESILAAREKISHQRPESSFKIPQTDGAGDDVAESASSPIRKRLRKCLKDSPCHVSKEERCNIHGREAQRRVQSAWGSLPITFEPLGCKNERQVSRTERTSPHQAVSCPRDNSLNFPQQNKVEVTCADSPGPVTSQQYRKGSKEEETGKEVSLRSLMRRQRKRQPHQRKSSPSGGSSFRDSHSEGEQSSGAAGNIFKSEFGGCMDTIFPDAVIEDEEVSQKHAVPAAQVRRYHGTQKFSQKSEDQGNLVQREGKHLPTFAVLPVVNVSIETDLADLQPRKHMVHKAQRSPTKGHLSGRAPRDKLSEDQLPFESSGEYQHMRLDSEVNENQEQCGEWGFGLLQSGDHRDCGGGNQSCRKITGSMVLERERGQFATLSDQETVSPGQPFSKEYQDLHLASTLGLTGTSIFTSENPKLDIKDFSTVAAAKPLVDALGSSQASQRLVHDGKSDTSLYKRGSLEEMEIQTSAGKPEDGAGNDALASPALTLVLDPVTEGKLDTSLYAPGSLEEMETQTSAGEPEDGAGNDALASPAQTLALDPVTKGKLDTSLYAPGSLEEMETQTSAGEPEDGAGNDALASPAQTLALDPVTKGKLDTSLYTPGSLEEMKTQTSVGEPEDGAGNDALASPAQTLALDPVNDNPNGSRKLIVIPSNLLLVGHVNAEPNVEGEVLLEAEGMIEPPPSGIELLPCVDHEVESGTASLGQWKAPAGQISNDNIAIAEESGTRSRVLYPVHAESEPRVQEDVKLQTDKTQMGPCSNIAVEASREQNNNNEVTMVRQVAEADSAPFKVPTELDFRLHLVETGCDGSVGGYKSQHQVSDKIKQVIHFTDISDESSDDSFDWGDDGGDFIMSDRVHEYLKEDSEDEFLGHPTTNRGLGSQTDVELGTENTIVATAAMEAVSNEEECMGSHLAASETINVSPEVNCLSEVPINAGRSLLVVQDVRMSELPLPALADLVVPEYTSPCSRTPEQQVHKLEQEPAPLPNVSEKKQEGKRVSFSEASVIWNAQMDTTEEEEKLIPVQYHQKPPTKAALLANLDQYGLKPVEYGGAFYGNSKDVPPLPTVSAGLIFDVKSKDAQDLPPFVFTSKDRNSDCSDGARCGPAVMTEDLGVDPLLVGVPCHYGNDGSVSYLLTPAKLPPSPSAVRQWLLDAHVSTSQNHSSMRGDRIFTMDSNTGKLVPLGIGSNESSQESLTMKDSGDDADMECFRPASPKYDEKHVLATPSYMHPLPLHPHAQSQLGAVRQMQTSTLLLNSNPVTPQQTTPVNSQSSSEIIAGEPNVPKPLKSDRSSCVVQSSGAVNIMGSSSHLMMPPPLLPAHNPPQFLDMGTSSLPASEFKEAGTSKEMSLVKKCNESEDKPVTVLRPKWLDVSQITAPSPAKGQLTPFSQSGFRDPASMGAGQQVTLMSIEVHSQTRGDLRPDPRYDAIGCIVVVIKHDDKVHASFNNQTVVLIVDANGTSSGRNIDGLTGCVVIYLSDELALFSCFVRLVCLCDPDMLVGWEIQGFSLGLLAERAANLGFGILKQLSRIPPKTKAASSNVSGAVSGMQQLQNSLFAGSKGAPLETVGINDPIIEDEWGRTHGSGIFVGGRVVLNLWRIMRGEVKLGIYTLEAVAEAVLRRRIPRIPWLTLTRWFRQGPAGGRFRCIEYFMDRARLNLEIMDQLDLLNRTAELARVFGIDFFSVFSRGSQYRVESMMLRLAHTQNFILISPNKQQVAAQPAMECLPLVMEPESRFYTSPVVVLDFQSLYPSMIIAYNLCFSTCLGKIVPNNPKVLGVTNLALRPGLLKELKEQLTITPNGVLYTPPEVCHGVLPRLLREILSTRIMVKQAMKKLSPEQRVLQRVLNARQFALKLIANVTYGYTAAGFSGRMPCAELADSIVQCGRLTLERAIHLVNSTAHWNAQVVYGDTDSMFVHLEGRTKEDAFKIGQEIAAAVTAMNPTPVTLKLEKVYHPCVLLTKKRYVGYSFESPGQVKPIFDAKGIETVRRDSCAAVAKTLERSLRILFQTQDLSQVKQYLQRQWGKILSGRISLHDFIFAKEVRLGTYSARASVLPPAAIVASKAMAVDPRAEPRYGERVPYVVVHGEPGARLSDVVVDPHTMLANGLRLHDTYYITKQIIPALQRVFGLVGADLKLWFAELPRVYRPPTSKQVGLTSNNPFKVWPDSNRRNKEGVQQKGTIDHYYLSQHCTVCGQLMRGSQLVCTACISNPQAVVTVLTAQTAQLEKEFKHLEALCRHCGGSNGEPDGHIACISLDCPIFSERLKVQKELQSSSVVSSQSASYPPCLLDLF